MQDHWDEFVNSSNWWSWSIVPLSYRDMLLAVAYGDAEVDQHGPPHDLFFRWAKPPGERSHEYFEKPADCGCEARFPKSR